MAEQLPLTIPQGMLPADGRFGGGHRSSLVTDQVTRLQNGVRELLDVPDDYEVALGNGGASAFWEISALGLVEKASQHIVQGSFSQKWANSVKAVPGLTLISREHEAPRKAASSSFSQTLGGDAYALTQNETSVGIKSDIKRPDDPAVLVMVDATSAAGAMEVDIKETDAYFFSLQKTFAAEGGLWVAVLSPAALERQERVTRTGRYIPQILDLGVAVDFSRKGQTYNTPAVGPIFLAAEMAETLLANGGLGEAAKRSAGMAQTVYDWAEKSEYAEPFILEAAERSTTTPVVQLNRVDAGQVAKVLVNNGISGTAAYRGIRDANMLRFATFPAVEPSDLEATLDCVDYVVEALA